VHDVQAVLVNVCKELAVWFACGCRFRKKHRCFGGCLTSGVSGERSESAARRG
jgi:hypothetical protein